MRDICILHHLLSECIFIIRLLPSLMHFRPHPAEYGLVFSPIMNNSLILGSLKYIVYNLTPVALVTWSVWFLWN